MCKVPLGDVVDLGVSQVERGKRRCTFVLVHMISIWACVKFAACCTVRCSWDVCTGAFEIQNKRGLQSIVQVVRMAHKLAQTRTHTRINTVRAGPEGNTAVPSCAAAVAPWLPQRTELGGRGDIYTAASYTRSTAKTKTLNLNGSLCSYLVAPTACSAARSLVIDIRKRTVHGCQTGKNLKRDCCCTVAA